MRDETKSPSVQPEGRWLSSDAFVKGYLTEATPKLQVQSERGSVLWPEVGEVAGPVEQQAETRPFLTGSEGALARGTHPNSVSRVLTTAGRAEPQTHSQFSKQVLVVALQEHRFG